MLRTNWFKWLAGVFPQAKVAVNVVSGRSLNYSQLNEMAGNLCLNCALVPGECITYLGEMTETAAIFFAAAQKSGAILIPLNYRLSPAELKVQIEMIGAQRLFYQEEFSGLAKKFDDHPDILESTEARETLWAESGEEHTELMLNSDSPICLFFTSGSSGTPKAVIYSHKMLYNNAVNTVQRLGISRNDRALAMMPAYHSGGWNVVVTPFWFVGAEVFMLPSFAEQEVLNAIEKFEITILMAVPTMLRRLAAHPKFLSAKLQSLRFIISGGESIDRETYEIYKKRGVQIRQGYGLTEAGPGLTSLPDWALDNIDSIGTPNFGVDIKIMRDDGEECPVYEHGEILVGGDMTTPGYWWRGAYEIPDVSAGYLSTGDMAYRDERGLIYLLGRKGNMYIRGGENVYPLEIERFLVNVNGVKKAAVIGVEDSRWGEVGVAFIEIDHPKSLNIEELRGHCARNLAAYKRPERFVILDSIPILPSGKTDYVSLRKTLQAPHRA